MTCAHPIREGHGYSSNFEIVGGDSGDTWGRCKTCGTWWWCVIDDGKFQFEDQRIIPTDLAEAGILRHDPNALAQLFVQNNLPYGPVWELSSALVSIFRLLTPGSSDAERAQSIEDAGAKGRWKEAARTLALEAKPRAARSELVFQVDLRVPNARLAEGFEVGDALVILSEGPELFRLDRKALVHLPLATPARLMASHPGALMVAVGPGFVVLDAAGQATSWPMASPYRVSELDDGWWLFVPETGEKDRAIEFHKPDGRGHVKLSRRFVLGQQDASSFMPPPRRFAGGWIVSNLIDDDGAAQALTLFDADFKTVAYSTGIDGERFVTPIDEETFWATLVGGDDIMERWVRRDKALDRAQTFACRSSYVVGGVLIADDRDGEVVARGKDGKYLWSWKRPTTGATYGVGLKDAVLLYDDARAHLLGVDGEVRRTFEVESPDVSVGKDGTAYLKTGAELFAIGDAITEHLVGLDTESVTTCGDCVLLRDEEGTCTLFGIDGPRGSFSAPEASFSVAGTRGLWVIEGDRIRGIFP